MKGYTGSWSQRENTALSSVGSCSLEAFTGVMFGDLCRCRADDSRPGCDRHLKLPLKSSQRYNSLTFVIRDVPSEKFYIARPLAVNDTRCMQDPRRSSSRFSLEIHLSILPLLLCLVTLENTLFFFYILIWLPFRLNSLPGMQTFVLCSHAASLCFFQDSA